MPPPGAPARVPRLIAHRGLRARFPENSLSGLRAALEAGAELLEFDVQLTADHEPVLMHDSTLDRLCGVPGDITRVHAADFASLRAYEPGRMGRQRFVEEPVATLADAVRLLEAHPAVQAFIELKPESIRVFGAQTVLERVSKTIEPVRTQCVLISFDTDVLELARERTDLRLGAVLREWEEREEAALGRVRPEFVFCDIRGLPDHGRLHIEGAQLGVFEVQTSDEALRLGHRGVELVETFDLVELKRQLAAPQRSRGRPRDRGGDRGERGDRGDRGNRDDRGNREERGDRDRSGNQES